MIQEHKLYLVLYSLNKMRDFAKTLTGLTDDDKAKLMASISVIYDALNEVTDEPVEHCPVCDEFQTHNINYACPKHIN